MGFLNQEMTDRDLAAWSDDLLTRIELRVLMEHEVIDHRAETTQCLRTGAHTLGEMLPLSR